jgi:hypothetical protein
MAGQIGELARDTLRRDFREIDPRVGLVLLMANSGSTRPSWRIGATGAG